MSKKDICQVSKGKFGSHKKIEDPLPPYKDNSMASKYFQRDKSLPIDELMEEFT